MCKVQMPKLQMHKLQMSMLVIHYYHLLISQFLKILLKIFSNEKMHKVQMHKLQMSILVIHHHQLLISQFLKILLKDFKKLMAMNLILVHWNIIMDCVVRYKNMMLIAEMKFEELTLKLVHTDLRSQTTTVTPIKYSGSVPVYRKVISYLHIYDMYCTFFFF
jgi:glucose-6-phosphate-specific signal transduction histidine kinase